MDDIDRLTGKIEEIISKSLVPEDPAHARNTLEWLLKLKPDADQALKIAVLGHDIERAIEERKVRPQNYPSYDDFKRAHALNSAQILREIMKECNINEELAEEVFSLVRYHETGGDSRTDILRDADSISFFQVNLPDYFVRNGVEETKRRCLWGYKRLPADLKKVVDGFSYQDKELEALMKDCFAEVEKRS
jgi:hypothetical protein